MFDRILLESRSCESTGRIKGRRQFIQRERRKFDEQKTMDVRLTAKSSGD